MKYLSFYDNKSGYIAITSAILISLAIIAIVLSSSSIGFRSRTNIVDSSSKATSKYAAEGCLELALLELAKDDQYLGGESFTINGNQCDILPIEDPRETPPQRIIKTQSTFSDTKTLLITTILLDDLSIVEQTNL